MIDTSSDALAGIGGLYREILSLLENCGHPAVCRMLDGQPVCPGQVVPLQPLSRPVLSCLSTVATKTSAQTVTAMQAILGVAEYLRWNQTYSDSDVPAHFLRNYAWGVVGSPEGPVRMEAMQMVLLFLGPNIEYPSHRHGPEEAYYVIAGNGMISLEGGEWEPLQPGSVIHNPPWQLHAIRTTDDPIIMVSLFQATTVSKSVFASATE